MAPQPFSVACNFDSCNELGQSIYDVSHDPKWSGTYHMGFVSDEFGLHIYSANDATTAVVGAIESATKGRLKIEIHMQRTGWAARDNEIVVSVGRKK